ncbi:MAG: AEC family transporter [Pseudomonadota bacterium]|nr:AEC family transporter [Pseudomonadota bacterium]
MPEAGGLAQTLLRIVGIIFPVLAVVAVGWLYGRCKRPDMTFANHLNLDVFAPALVFWALADQPLDVAAFSGLAIGGAAVILGSGLLLLPLVLLIGINPRTFLPPMMFNNSGNMGLPLAIFAFGEAALQAAVVLFIIEMVLHFTVGLYILDHRTRLTRLFRMPIIIAAFAGLAVSIGGVSLPAPIANTLKLLGQVSIPLLMFSLGVRLLEVDFRDWGIGTLGALLCPLSGVAVVLLVRPWLDLNPMHSGLLLIFGALPPAVFNYILAEQYNQEPKKVASIVMLGNLGSVVAIPLALYFALPPG